MPATRGQPKSIETRLGLVMYGGVALAIYINGVAREFFGPYAVTASTNGSRR